MLWAGSLGPVRQRETMHRSSSGALGSVNDQAPIYRESVPRRVIAGTFAALFLLSGCGAGQPVSDGSKDCRRIAAEESVWLTTIGQEVLGDRVSKITEYNGCDSSNNGVWLFVDLKPDVPEAEAFALFVKAGWSKQRLHKSPCRACIDGYSLGQRVRGRTVGIKVFQRDPSIAASAGDGTRVEIAPVDGCWDDDGYRCSG